MRSIYFHLTIHMEFIFHLTIGSIPNKFLTYRAFEEIYVHFVNQCSYALNHRSNNSYCANIESIKRMNHDRFYVFVCACVFIYSLFDFRTVTCVAHTEFEEMKY